jgi:hypothetical protein
VGKGGWGRGGGYLEMSNSLLSCLRLSAWKHTHVSVRGTYQIFFVFIFSNKNLQIHTISPVCGSCRERRTHMRGKQKH